MGEGFRFLVRLKRLLGQAVEHPPGRSAIHPCVLVVVVFFSASPAAWAAAASSYRDSKSIFTIQRDPSHPTRHIREVGCGSGRASELSADVAVVEFSESGSFVDDRQLKIALACIAQAREKNRNGAVVMMFVHGWRHSSSWDDEHFGEFRTVLLSLALREAERSGATYRRVIGIYLGWPGGHLGEFRKRYETAQRIGRGSAMRTTIQEIVKTTKRPVADELLGSPVILVGHSMGALMFQTAYSSLLATGGVGPVEASPAEKQRCARVYEGGRIVGFPDLVLLLNSATDSQITKVIIEQVKAKGLSKQVQCGDRSFHAPLFISASAQNDYATQWLYWAASLGRSTTDGNDRDLINYTLRRGGGALCPPVPGVPDYGQSWHCLRQPDISNDQVVHIKIDLPQREAFRDACHVRYHFERLTRASEDVAFWVFQVPFELMDGHGDIFNGRARLLIMALVQMSGATMSVHKNYRTMFEAEGGNCSLP